MGILGPGAKQISKQTSFTSLENIENILNSFCSITLRARLQWGEDFCNHCISDMTAFWEILLIISPTEFNWHVGRMRRNTSPHCTQLLPVTCRELGNNMMVLSIRCNTTPYKAIKMHRIGMENEVLACGQKGKHTRMLILWPRGQAQYVLMSSGTRITLNLSQLAPGLKKFRHL